MMRGLSWITFLVMASLLIVGCAGDEKGVNKNKEKPQPTAK
jgi:hypothetical protein